MSKFRIVYTVTEVKEEVVDADDFDDAKNQFEELGLDADLFFIEDENGLQLIFD